ncbi:DNA primase [Seohaeicola sp. SP36]|uniref:DNA primase n=1 Tax=unclassified Seohaeicola TaxID=2641111 RepID=UPI00237AE7F9|nr:MULTISPECIES: DNA primase [unclassified Seohaeicola]MDD9707494.1 DNA primase [Seohaeicola sp. 4SK31]MDD9735735.1 DNA primase [Seohaeicola sp. SP36]
MSLPPGFLDELRTRISLSQVVGRKVMWDMRKSNQGKGDMWAPCPFHQEKSASFHVDDRKGYYYCFGCHAKGDALSFVRETENVGFMEAVEILAREAGMQMPARDPQAQQKADRRTQLVEVMEQAAQFFALQLRTGAAGPARDYLAKRGLKADALERFGIGFAPDGWQGLWDHLTAKNVPEDLILAAGLAKPSNTGKRPYDVFRNRIMFPIRDARGRCIAFGGRAMDPNDNAKYLNSPDTELFDKGRNLYNFAAAREAAGKGKPLIVAEGYMDVIALSEAGFTAAVAPLGTAVTDTQLQLMWRIAPEPIIALDGDSAGIRAALRVIDLALPLLEAGQSLRFAVMPEGKDPDDLIRASGAGAMQALLDQAVPMVDLLWRRETEGQVFDSPERRATLDKALREKIKLIKDPSIRAHYGEALKEMRWELFGTRRRANTAARAARPAWTPGSPRWQPAPVPQSSTKSSLLAQAGDGVEDHLREAVIFATLITTPAVIEEFEGQIEQMDCQGAGHAALRDALLRTAMSHGHDPDALRASLEQEVGAQLLESLFALPHVRIVPPVRQPGNTEMARMTVAEELAKLTCQRGLISEIAEAEEDLEGLADEAVTWRLSQAAEARNRALRSQQQDRTEYDTGPNGARINRDERSALDALMDKITFTKRGR